MKQRDGTRAIHIPLSEAYHKHSSHLHCKQIESMTFVCLKVINLPGRDILCGVNDSSLKITY